MPSPAVLFVVFNRPHETALTFAQIRKARPARLYVAADGPRLDVPGEWERCQEVRAIATAVDWDCDVATLRRDVNLGCKVGVSSAIDWFFENESEGVILEDDCLPAQAFFEYCSLMLETFRHDPEVMFVAGSSLNRPAYSHQPYRFTRIPMMWGWATWASAWRHFDVTMKDWPTRRKRQWLASQRLHRYSTRESVFEMFEGVLDGSIDSWGIAWLHSVWSANGIGVMPTSSLVQNIGFGSGATHTRSADDPRAQIRARETEVSADFSLERELDAQEDEELLTVWFEATAAKAADLRLLRWDRLLTGGRLRRAVRSFKAKLRERSA